MKTEDRVAFQYGESKKKCAISSMGNWFKTATHNFLIEKFLSLLQKEIQGLNNYSEQFEPTMPAACIFAPKLPSRIKQLQKV